MWSEGRDLTNCANHGHTCFINNDNKFNIDNNSLNEDDVDDDGKVYNDDDDDVVDDDDDDD